MLLLIFTLVLAGCAHLQGQPRNAAVQRDIIEAGQPWAEAKSVADRAGYEVRYQDPIGVEWQPQPAGFVIRLDKDFDLYIVRDKTLDTVEFLRLVANPGKPKVWRADIQLQSFIVPMSTGMSRVMSPSVPP